MPLPFSLTCLCSYRFPCSWYHSGVFVRNPWLVNVDAWLHVRQFSFDCSFTCGHMPAGSQHCGMKPTQSEIPLLLESFSLVFFLDRCRLLFVWLVCPLTGPRVLGITVVLYSEIATLWLHSHSVWDSSGFRARFSSLMVLCHSRFVWRVCVPTGSRVLGITVVYLFEILGWSSLMFEMMFGNFRLTAVLEAVICLLDRNTVAWYPFSLIFVPFWADLIISLKLCRFFFIWQIVFFPVPVFFVLNWYISSRSLVGQRWCLRWCLVIFVWLQC